MRYRQLVVSVVVEGDDGVMVELPTGTVSLLFSDIEGSTMLLSRLGPAYAGALDGQRQVLRRAWAEHHGTELGTEGDSFFVVFPTAEDAVAAAAQAQRELALFDWPAGERVRVRMGVHTGSPQVHDGGYVGMDVHRAARIAGSANGGQVVLSQATAHLIDGSPPPGVRVLDFGVASVERPTGCRASLPADHRRFAERLSAVEDTGCRVEPAGSGDCVGGP